MLLAGCCWRFVLNAVFCVVYVRLAPVAGLTWSAVVGMPMYVSATAFVQVWLLLLMPVWLLTLVMHCL